MKTFLQSLGSKLTAIALILIVAYIGYNELFRGSRVGDELNAALTESKRVQKDMRYLATQLQQQGTDLKAATANLIKMGGQLTTLKDSITVLNTRYQAVSSTLKQQVSVSLDRYQQQKKTIQDIQKQIR